MILCDVVTEQVWSWERRTGREDVRVLGELGRRTSEMGAVVSLRLENLKALFQRISLVKSLPSRNFVSCSSLMGNSQLYPRGKVFDL